MIEVPLVLIIQFPKYFHAVRKIHYYFWPC